MKLRMWCGGTVTGTSAGAGQWVGFCDWCGQTLVSDADGTMGPHARELHVAEVVGRLAVESGVATEAPS